MPAASENKRLAAKEIIDILHEIATLLVRGRPSINIGATNTISISLEYPSRSSSRLTLRLPG